jgi:hypothetical protein
MNSNTNLCIGVYSYYSARLQESTIRSPGNTVFKGAQFTIGTVLAQKGRHEDNSLYRLMDKADYGAISDREFISLKAYHDFLTSRQIPSWFKEKMTVCIDLK